MSGIVWLLDYASVLIFALTGALVASRAQLDLVGFVFFAALTGIGGGTVRDLVLGRSPVFWVERPGMILMICAAAILVFFSAHLLESRYRWLTWLDAAALAFAVPAGTGVALGMGTSAVICVVMGIITGCFGGLLRDTVANELPMVLKQGELYVTAAFGGALVAVATAPLGGVGLVLSALVVIGLRAGSLLLGWRLPTYRPRPPRR